METRQVPLQSLCVGRALLVVSQMHVAGEGRGKPCAVSYKIFPGKEEIHGSSTRASSFRASSARQLLASISMDLHPESRHTPFLS